jgi:hypothetical protein
METLTRFLQSFFNEDVTIDVRTPLSTFEIPFVEGQFALYAPNLEGWKQLTVFVLMQSVVQVVFAVVIHKLIVQQRGTMQSYLVGWGFVLPISLYLPFFFLELLDIRSKILGMSSTTVMTVIFFRCLEAMYGTSNDVVMESSLWNYCAYFSSVVPFVWDPKTKRRKAITTSKFLSTLLEVLVNLMAVSLVLSVLIHYRFKPFNDSIKLTELCVSRALISKEHLLNSYCHAGEYNAY